MPLTKHARRCLITLLLVGATVPAVIYGALLGSQMKANAPGEWMPRDFPARRDYELFMEAFGTGDLAVIGWPGCTVDDPRLERFATALANSPEAYDRQGRPHIGRFDSGYHAVRSLTGDPLNLPRAEALRRLQGSLVGPDGQRSCAVIVLTQQGADDRTRAIDNICSILENECGIPRRQQHMAGPIVDGYFLDRASEQSLNWFGPPSAVAILLMAWWMLRSFRVALGVFLLSLYCAVLTLALVHYFQQQYTAIHIIMPPFVLALAVAGSIHMVNYHFDAQSESNGSGTTSKALAMAWLPCTLSAGTTTIGLASLTASDIASIRTFGALSAAGIVATLVLLLSSIPGAFDLGILPRRRSSSAHRSPSAGAATAASLNWINRRVERHHRAIGTVALALLISASCGLPWLTASVQVRTLFSPRSDILRDYAWLEEHVASLIPIELVVRFDQDGRLDFRQQMELVGRIEQELADIEMIDGTMSAWTFAPQLPSSASTVDVVRRAVVFRALENHRQWLVERDYLYESDQARMWRVTARVSALADVDYGHFLNVVRARVEPLLENESNTGARGISTIYTGVMPMVHQIQRELMSSLVWSFLSALALITLITMIVQRGVLTGLTVMVPNVFPVAILFGLLGWWRVPIDIGSVMTASVALGMAIDGTFHYLTFFRRALDQGATQAGAVHDAYRRCASAITEGTLICMAGMLIFTFDPFVPSSRFAWMIIGLLTLALLGDLVVLPALLLGPAGRLFRRHAGADDQVA